MINKFKDFLKNKLSRAKSSDGSDDEHYDEELLEDGVAFAGVSQFPVRIKCALLGWMAFKDASTQVMA